MRSSSKSPFLLKASAVYVTALLSCVFVFIIVCAADGFFMGGRGLFTSVWHPESKQFGILPVMAATAALSLSSLALGWLVSFGCVCYIHGFGGKCGGICRVRGGGALIEIVGKLCKHFTFILPVLLFAPARKV